jgi:hypothetical protein
VRGYVKLAPGDKVQLELEAPAMRRVLASSCDRGARGGVAPRTPTARQAEKGVVSWQDFPVVLMLSLRLRMAF